MSSEESFQDELKKLEIGFGMMSQESSDNAKNQCFHVEKIKTEQINSGRIFGDSLTKCGCRIRQNSESNADNSEKPRTPSTSAENNSSMIHKIIHRKSLKPKIKPVLRDPIMKSLQNCSHPKSLKRSCSVSSETSSHPHFLEALNLASVNTRVGAKSKSHPLDFRDLIDQCNELEITKTKKSDLMDNLKKTTDFTSIQRTDIRTKGTPQLRNCPSCSQEARINGSVSHSRHSGHNGPNSHNLASSLAMSGAIGTNSSGVDDTSMDELASYFDTFVHIPKKMSSMAEMMYN